MTKEWLQEKIKTKELVIDTKACSILYKKMRFYLREQIKENDEFWTFSSPLETWHTRSGRRGICVVRGGEVFDYFLTAVN